MKNKKVLALFGGAFNPPTMAHSEIAARLITKDVADKVLVVPARSHRYKNSMAPLEHRMAMLQQLFQKHPYPAGKKQHPEFKIGVMDVDADLGMPEESFGSTWNLAHKVQELFPDYKVMIVVGADNAMDLPNFYRGKELLKTFEFICISRGGYTGPVPATLEGIRLEMDLPGSSTDARKLLYAKRWGEVTKLLHDCTMQYCRDNKVYKLVTGGPDLLPDGSNYDKDAYAKAANTVDITIVRLNGENLEVLLIKRKWNPHQGMWAIPGGFVEIIKEEGLESAAIRELEEETQAVGIPVTQLATYGEPGRDCRDRVISTVYYALLPQGGMDKQNLKAKDDAKEFQWRTLSEDMETSDLAFDHAAILMDLLKLLRKEARYTPLPFSLLPKMFTWKQVQASYKALLGREVSNIRRKLGRRYIIEDAGSKRSGDRNRPAGLFRFKGERDQL
jgi:8-oxo-dGTP diphosphatase